jgi:hypothetical protein
MVTVSYELVLCVFALGLAAGGLSCLIACILGGIWLNTRDKKVEDEEDGLVIPMSALMGGGVPGGGRAVSYADLQRAAAEVAAHGQGKPPEKNEAGPPQTNAYL